MTATTITQDDTPVRHIPRHASLPNRLGQWLIHQGWRHLVALVALVFALFPILFILSTALNPIGTLTSANALFGSASLDNIHQLLNDANHPYAAWFRNSMIIGFSTATGAVLLGACAAYAFSRFRFRGRRGGLLALLLLQMFPQLLAYVAIFLLLTTLKQVFPVLGLDSQLGLIMVYLGGALGVNTYLMYGFFNTVPREIEESAIIDGAGHSVIFFAIILRLAAPILAVVGLLTFIATLNDFLIASIVLTTPENQTLAVGLYQYVSESFSKNWGVFGAGAILAALPVVLIFLFLQKFIVSGLTAGSVKG